MSAFRRGLTPQCREALAGLRDAEGANWWKEVLTNDKLLIFVRGGYLNAYAKGQSAFRVGSPKGTGVIGGVPIVEMHYKYLIAPTLERRALVRFDGSDFALDPAEAIQQKYKPGITVKQIAETAALHSEAEKEGVHKIAVQNPNVLDVEVSFRHGRATLRMDLAVVIAWEGGARVVFCEAKCANNAELSSREANGQIAVKNQVDRYEAFIAREEVALAEAYVTVCKELVTLGVRSKRVRGDLVHAVAEGRVSLSLHPRIFLLVYDFTKPQKSGSFGRTLEALRASDCLGNRLIAKGDAKAFRLADDIGRRARAEASDGEGRSPQVLLC